ncbi:extracellular solute-binding protein [Dactylosporangium sucinum]|uniref:Lipoprotein n=1 Tax=Dactylosporangium sucinum TaxID=1424081 RepID=A0A917SZ49_9ACTN|nr:extracellular solute-binding protein [Dactylosporangium sucinum]GGM05113.1 lipoprotein [Dactylosporangium sucinum]
MGSHRLSRRGLLASIGVIAATPLLDACGSPKENNPGTTSQTDLSKVLPAFVPATSVKPDIASVTGAAGGVTDPTFLSYPASPPKTVTGPVGSGGTYVTMTPLWGAIPPSSGNAYYDAVNKELGATVKIQPADGNTYGDLLAPLFASDKLPDWIDIPSWNISKLNFGEAVRTKFADLTPYLSGDNIKQYPNLAAIPTNAWVSAVWNGKLYGLPIYSSGAVVAGAYFYRKDLFDKAGVSADIKSVADLEAVGKALTNAAAGQWAFDDLFGDDAGYIGQLYGFPSGNYPWTDNGGKLVHRYETDGIVEALNWHAKMVKAGYLHPDAVANNSQNAKQRFWSGKVAVCADGTGAWNGDDTKSGAAANPSYNRQAFKTFSATGGQPTVEIGNGAGMYSYLNKKLSDKQIKELLSIANYLAAPYGSAEWLTVNFGVSGTHYTMQDGNPLLTEQGSKEIATSYQFLASPLSPTTVKSGNAQVAKDYAAWQADMVKYLKKPLFYGMNVSEPAQFGSLTQPMKDTITDVKLGRKPISAWTEAVANWRRQGGDDLRKFYEDIRTKYGTGQ